MSGSQSTLLLDTVNWDWVADAQGNWAVADVPYALAQDVSSQIRLFIAECYYDQSQGIPYFGNILGQAPPYQFIKAKIQAAALLVPGVVASKCVITRFSNRNLEGYVVITSTVGKDLTVVFQ